LVSLITQRGEKLKVVGAGHAMSPIAMSNGHLVNLDKVNRVFHLDKVSKHVTVEAGIRLKELLDFLNSNGLTMANLGQIMEQSVAGAISTSTHGSTVINKQGKLIHGSISSQIISMEIIDSDGKLHNCSKSRNSDLFSAARVGLGAIGVIARVELQVVDLFNLERFESYSTLPKLYSELYTKHLKVNDYFRFWWVPTTDKVKTMSFTKTDRMVPLTYYRKNVEVPLLVNILGLDWIFGVKNIMWFISQLICTEDHYYGLGYEMLTGPVPDSYAEMEYFVPLEKFVDAHKAFVEYVMTNTDVTMNFINENRFIGGDDIWLSPFYERDSASISIILYRRDAKTWEKFSRGAEKVLMKFEGRPHWGKVHWRNKQTLKQQYPHWDDWMKIREQVDPHGTFLNEHLLDVFQIENKMKK